MALLVYKFWQIQKRNEDGEETNDIKFLSFIKEKILNN